MTLTLQSPAKLNLFLHITGQRPDGYHTLQTVFQLIDLCDEISFTPRNDEQVILSCNLPALATGDNLILKAANAIKPQGNRKGCHIHLNKVIPIGGGLGGGSSNAATTLLALNHLWDLNLSEDQLLAHALKLGADVPVFVKGLTCFAEGVGETLTPIACPNTAFLIVQPPAHVNTQKIFSSIHLTRNTKPITIRDYQAGVPTHNDFESLVRAQYPEIEAAFKQISHLGQPKLTGTGACIFITCQSLQQAQDLVGQCAAPVVAFAAQGLRQSPLHTAFWGVAKW